ncbi:sensor histidine kinase [Clostridium sp. JNZ J1-5]|nr:HAMP domain-containing sensor histidine kinase [Clostridium sp.]
MRKIKIKSLALRIWLIFTIVILAIILSISAVYLFVIRNFEEQNKFNSLEIAHEIVLKDRPEGEPIKGVKDLELLKFVDHFVVVKEKNSEKTIKEPYRKHLEPEIQNVEAIRKWMTTFIKDGPMEKIEFKEKFNNKTFLFIISSISKDAKEDTYLISYLEPKADNEILEKVVFIGIVFILLSFIAAKFIANSISKPLKQLEEYTKRISKKDWAEAVEVDRYDEIGRLMVAMNTMQKSLKAADEEEKLFLQSISHDLKTPVAVIIGYAQAIIDKMYIGTVEETANTIKEEAQRLDKKIKQILYLNSLDYVMKNNNESTEINLDKLVESIANKFRQINPEIKWKVDLEESIIHGDVEKIKVCIENIVDNAVRYAAEEISISLKVEDCITLEIYNDGANISEKHRNHIFENFYKDKKGNFGLGLAISKKIMDYYKGEISAINREKGVSFILKFFSSERMGKDMPRH